jgi:3-mercaptopyruvate sulfurtransferase SseA
MTCPQFILAAALISFASCAPPAQEAPAPAPAQKTEASAKPVKKQPRLNGRGKVSSISLTEAFTLQQSGEALIYDARPPFYFALGHLPGAINLPKANCDEQILKREAEIKAALAAKKTIIVYCTNFACPDARTVAIHLASFGHSSSTLTGGWDAWKDAGLPTE